MYIINFSHKMNELQFQQIKNHLEENGFNTDLLEELHKPATFDLELPLTEQVTRLVNSVALETWQDSDFVIIPPAYAPASAIAIAYIHGLSGNFPAIVRLKAVMGVTTTYEFSEIINLNGIRAEGRMVR